MIFKSNVSLSWRKKIGTANHSRVLTKLKFLFVPADNEVSFLVPRVLKLNDVIILNLKEVDKSSFAAAYC